LGITEKLVLLEKVMIDTTKAEGRIQKTVSTP
jgi:hypothetical protein